VGHMEIFASKNPCFSCIQADFACDEHSTEKVKKVSDSWVFFFMMGVFEFNRIRSGQAMAAVPEVCRKFPTRNLGIAAAEKVGRQFYIKKQCISPSLNVPWHACCLGAERR